MNLYEQLCYLFGIEDYVRLRRHLVFLRESIYNCYHNGRKVVCSGSLGEGVAYPPSDDDLMFYPTSLRVVKSYRDATQEGDLLMVPSESSPGYCRLLPAVLYHTNIFLSSMLWKQLFLREGEIVHGPCVSQINGDYEYDHAFCIRCSFWPDVADNWISRNRSYDWPSRNMIRNIVMDGCHVVPVGDQTSSFCQYEWRLSFSVAERKLFHSFNHSQFLMYNLLRLCLKRILNERCDGVLCSYFMKTTLFYVAENTATQFWQQDNIEACFRTCLSVLHDYVYHGYCPNYFIPDYNMIKRKLNNSNRHQLLEIIRLLHIEGISGAMILCGESDCLNRILLISQIEMESDLKMFMFNIPYTMDSLNKVFNSLKYANNSSLNVSLCRILRFLQCDSIGLLKKIFVRKIITYHCQSLIRRLGSSDRTLYIPMNKRNYNLHKIIQFLLRVVYNEDVTTGKLTAATYMYLVGKTESSLLYIRRLLSEYPPYTIDLTLNDIKISAYMDVMCGRGYTMDHKVYHAHSPPYILHRCFADAFPMSLRIWLFMYKDNHINLDPLSYAYFLESLCHHRLQNRQSLKKSTRCLINRLYDDLKNYYVIVHTRICVGILKYVQGDSQSACRWLGSAYLRKIGYPAYAKKELTYSVMSYIACMINHRYLADNNFQSA